VIELPVVFVEVKPGILPVPLAPKPIAVFELVHANIAPEGVLLRFPIGIAAPEQAVISEGTVATGTGLTVTVTLFAGLTQPETVAVTE
jgi:hypothetical protein